MWIRPAYSQSLCISQFGKNPEPIVPGFENACFRAGANSLRLAGRFFGENGRRVSPLPTGSFLGAYTARTLIECQACRRDEFSEAVAARKSYRFDEIGDSQRRPPTVLNGSILDQSR